MASHQQNKLMLLRHAKAEFQQGVPDHERSLSSRGHADAPLIGRWMVEHDAVPDSILVSTALRTRQTCTWVCKELGDKAPTPKLEDDLYAAHPTEMLALINHVPATVTSLLVIAHNPGVQELAMRLASARSSERAVMDLATDYPTAGLTVLTFDGEWAELDHRNAEVTDFVVRRAPTLR
ncbi:histidine phosphatase family protein [Arthrobacter echini]|uniref:Histidine phosphatase family protein n=1 Tax=Arthrobacter echini TaxID=1529066 RepID=A0A5D0XPE0_9MICC|nr:histidine phosphatase family protein [Arthrobacter echini]TYC98402.1 histidine phosphatase family protein [Arthrobacter echini]